MDEGLEEKASALFAHARERDEIIDEAENSLGRSAAERFAMFRSIQGLIEAIWNRLDAQEKQRRLENAERLDPRPDPWWRNVRCEELP